jgi:hypothetical protein
VNHCQNSVTGTLLLDLTRHGTRDRRARLAARAGPVQRPSQPAFPGGSAKLEKPERESTRIRVQPRRFIELPTLLERTKMIALFLDRWAAEFSIA